jgi:hypothetical protein
MQREASIEQSKMNRVDNDSIQNKKITLEQSEIWKMFLIEPFGIKMKGFSWVKYNG